MSTQDVPETSGPRPPMPENEPPRTDGCLSRLALPMALFIGLFGVVLGAAFGFYSGKKAAVPPSPSMRVIRSTPSVVTAVRELSRLEGAEYHIERVVELTETQRRLFGLLEAEDAILLVASGQVVAGVDLTALGEGDAQVDDERRAVRLRLPQPEIFLSRLDNERTYVHSRETDLLAARKESLEAEARREAEATLERAAREAGIVETAKSGVRRTITGLLRGLGFETVTVEFSER